MLTKFTISAGAALVMTTSVMAADEVSLPKTIALTSYDVGGNGL